MAGLGFGSGRYGDLHVDILWVWYILSVSDSGSDFGSDCGGGDWLVDIGIDGFAEVVVIEDAVEVGVEYSIYSLDSSE